jgi:hypothetical protein
VSGEFDEALRRAQRDLWPRFSLLIPERLREHDDFMWLPRIGLHEALKSDALLYIRGGLSSLAEHERRALVSRTVMPFSYAGDKAYGLELGWWKTIDWTGTKHGTLLPWDESFAIKPLSGTHAVDVHMWTPGKRGRSTRTQIRNALRARTQMYLQPFIAPMPIEINGTIYNAILRPYFAFDIHARRWVPLHGTWTARPHPNLRIHGASDSIAGPLRVEHSMRA